MLEDKVREIFADMVVRKDPQRSEYLSLIHIQMCIRDRDYPDAVALLYALYLYAEHTGRKTFTFTELVNAHSNPEAQGISPHDIYGIDAKDFREKVQGLAMTYPQYIRVSFIANLDNIILEDYASIDILDLAENE